MRQYATTTTWIAEQNELKRARRRNFFFKPEQPAEWVNSGKFSLYPRPEMKSPPEPGFLYRNIFKYMNMNEQQHLWSEKL